MPTWIMTVLRYFGPLLIEWATKLFKRIYRQIKLKKKAEQNIERAEQYENNPTNSDPNQLP